MIEREIFKPAQKAEAATDPTVVFYTLTADDVDSRLIMTEIGPVVLAGFFGAVLREDVGKRLYRFRDNADHAWYWEAEGAEQRDKRLTSVKQPAPPSGAEADSGVIAGHRPLQRYEVCYIWLPWGPETNKYYAEVQARDALHAIEVHRAELMTERLGVHLYYVPVSAEPVER